mmetsp:Transcript_5854/g.10546  ORF Transcript_5854/g.10546 Transcript_5854/m.10546 type:complete len:289 (-) Transcript_5854:137-1003(-)
MEAPEGNVLLLALPFSSPSEGPTVQVGHHPEQQQQHNVHRHHIVKVISIRMGRPVPAVPPGPRGTSLPGLGPAPCTQQQQFLFVLQALLHPPQGPVPVPAGPQDPPFTVGPVLTLLLWQAADAAWLAEGVLGMVAGILQLPQEVMAAHIPPGRLQPRRRHLEVLEVPPHGRGPGHPSGIRLVPGPPAGAILRRCQAVVTKHHPLTVLQVPPSTAYAGAPVIVQHRGAGAPRVVHRPRPTLVLRPLQLGLKPNGVCEDADVGAITVVLDPQLNHGRLLPGPVVPPAALP